MERKAPIGRLWLVIAPLLWLSLPARAADPADPLVEISVKQVPVRVALERLYPPGGSPRLVFAPGTPNPPVSANLRGVARSTALRALLRMAALSAKQSGDVVTVSQQPAAPPTTITTGVTFGTSAVTGSSVGPGGARIPNTTGSYIRTTRRTVDGQPALLGEVGNSRSDGSRLMGPGITGGSRTASGGGTTTSFFLTVTVLPDPADDGRRTNKH
jgi:hypothetical protein